MPVECVQTVHSVTTEAEHMHLDSQQEFSCAHLPWSDCLNTVTQQASSQTSLHLARLYTPSQGFAATWRLVNASSRVLQLQSELILDPAEHQQLQLRSATTRVKHQRRTLLHQQQAGRCCWQRCATPG